MSRKLFGLSALALLVAATLAMATPSAATPGLTAVGDDVAVSVSGGQYCPTIYYYGNYGCGMTIPNKGTQCPYCPIYSYGNGTPVGKGNVGTIACYECCNPCGYCNIILPCVQPPG